MFGRTEEQQIKIKAILGDEAAKSEVNQMRMSTLLEAGGEIAGMEGGADL